MAKKLIIFKGATAGSAGYGITKGITTLGSNMLPGVSVGKITSNLQGTASLIDDAGSVVAIDAAGNLTTGVAPADYSSAQTVTPVVRFTSTDGKTIAQQPIPVPVAPLSVTLNTVTGPPQSLAGLTPGYYIGNASNTFDAAAINRTPSKLTLTTDTSGTPYTADQVRLNIDAEFVTGGTALGPSDAVSLYVKEDMGGTIKFSPYTLSGKPPAPPSNLTFTSYGTVSEYCALGMETVVGRVQATNNNLNGGLTYLLTSNPGLYWDIDHDTGEIYPVRDIKYAAAASYALQAVVRDGVGNTVGPIAVNIPVRPWDASSLTVPLFGTTIVAHADFSATGNLTLDGSGNIDALSDPTGSWSKVGATGPASVASGQNGLSVARFTGAQALKISVSGSNLAGQSGAVGGFSVLAALKNTHSGASVANIVAFLTATNASGVSVTQTSNDAALSINSSASWTAIPQNTPKNFVLSDPGSNLYEFLDNTNTGSITAGIGRLNSTPITQVVFGGTSGTTSPSTGFVGDLYEIAIVKGAVNSRQREGWARYVAAKWGLGAQAVYDSIDLSQYDMTLGEEFDNQTLTWVEGGGTFSPNGLYYNSPNAAGVAQQGHTTTEDCWYLDPRNPLVSQYQTPIKQRSSRMNMKADKTKPPLKNIIGNTLYPSSAGFQAGSFYGYTGAWVTTDNQFKQMYGFFESRARMSACKGLWPATLWLYSAEFDQWELDVVEIFGDQPNGQPLRKLQFTTHLPNGGSQIVTPSPVTSPQLLDFEYRKGGYGPNNLTWATDESQDWSIETGRDVMLGVDWQPDYTTYYVNRKPVGRFPTPTMGCQTMYMMADLTVSKGGFATPPDAQSVFPAYLSIDYLRAWAKRGPASLAVSGTNARTTAFVNAVTAAGGSLSSSEQTLLNAFFNSLDSYTLDPRFDGGTGTGMPDFRSVTLSQKRDAAYCFLFADPIAQRTDLFRPTAGQLSVVGNVTITPSGGVKGDGSTGYLETGYDVVANTGPGKYSGRDGGVDAWILSMATADTGQYAFGSAMMGLGVAPIAKTVSVYNNGVVRNAAISAVRKGSPTPVTNPGFYSGNRVNNQSLTVRDSVNAYYNGAFIGFRTSQQVSSNFAGGKTTQILGQNGLTARSFSDARLGFVSWGASMLPAENSQYYQIVRTLLNGLNPSLVS